MHRRPGRLPSPAPPRSRRCDGLPGSGRSGRGRPGERGAVAIGTLDGSRGSRGADAALQDGSRWERVGVRARLHPRGRRRRSRWVRRGAARTGDGGQELIGLVVSADGRSLGGARTRGARGRRGLPRVGRGGPAGGYRAGGSLMGDAGRRAVVLVVRSTAAGGRPVDRHPPVAAGRSPAGPVHGGTRVTATPMAPDRPRRGRTTRRRALAPGPQRHRAGRPRPRRPRSIPQLEARRGDEQPRSRGSASGLRSRGRVRARSARAPREQRALASPDGDQATSPCRGCSPIVDAPSSPPPYVDRARATGSGCGARAP